ncbi:hypothetical protein MPTK1_2g02180 [Marchantia polymorpha subsp. ruderalis]|nr:hypothetical protein Mp_2g02180 [Marchantia polymorpha subsp. ruderalis]
MKNRDDIWEEFLTWSIDLWNDAHAMTPAVSDKVDDVLLIVDELRTERSFDGQVRLRFNLQRKGLRVRYVQMKDVQFVVAQSANRSFDVFDGEKIASYVQENSAVRVIWLIRDEHTSFYVQGSVR